jgi:hypothetical protein
MHDVGVKYGEETMKEHYYSLEEAKTDVEKVRATLKTVLNGIRSVYVKAKKEVNFALVALFVQPMAFDELEAFCKNSEIKKHVERRGYKFFPDLYDLKKIVEAREEEWVDEERKFYELNENWRHMRLFLDVLCNEEEEVKREVKTVRSILLEIMDEELERTARTTSRMLLTALDNITWLKEEANAKPIKQALRWGTVALLYSPKIGFDFLPLISELVEDVERDEQLLASAYAYRLIRTSIVMNFSLDAVNAIIGISEHLISNPTRDSAVLAYRAEIYSSIAVMLSGYGIKRTSYFYMEKAERVMKSIGDEKVRNIAKIGVWMYKAELYSLFSFSNISEAWNWAENALSLIEEVRKRINDYVSNEFVINHFKPYGGNAEERLKEGLDDCHGHAKCLIGRIYMVFDWLEEAEEVFKEALKYSMVFDEKLGIHGFIGTIKAIRDFQFEDFENLYKQMKMYKHRLSTIVIINTCAGYVLACLVSGKKVEKEEEVMEYLKTNLRVYALLLGVAHKLYGRFDHEEVLKALERLETEQRGSSQAILAKVLRMLIKNKRESAFEVARRTVYDIAQESLFIFSRLFAELADGIERGDEEETNKALVKLFYIHV